MRPHDAIITKFYTAFANQDAVKMAACYHTDIAFSDPVFGKLYKKEVAQMWTMLLARSKNQLKISFSKVQSDEKSGSAIWVASYLFSKTNRQVVNHVQATFEFKDGLIIKHNDYFNLWKWSSQAFGLKGMLLGWTAFMQNKIRKQARQSLNSFGKNQ